ncbi:MAG: hypothetical protein C4527_16390 [Candidatus Omnitrophota bacterium]|jgi:hypothetical protein|nr:MAG: hypothetical protein C4527_16390 [Candidatus Omnitrophota bacterium]
MNRYVKLNLLLIVVGITAQGCVRINPDEIGVKTVNLGEGKGIVAHDYEPGYHRYLWPLDSWHRFPRTVLKMEFLKTSIRTAESGEGPLVVTSADGDRVTMNAEVFYRIAEGMAHRVLQDSGMGANYVNIVKTLSIDAARAIFGQLKTEDFYHSEKREQIRMKANAMLRERLILRGIDLVDFLVISLEFDPAYEELIKQKKIADQMVSLEISKALAAEEQGNVNMIKQETLVKLKTIEKETESEIVNLQSETDLQIAVLLSESRKYTEQQKADADLYRQQKQAEGMRLLKSAEAEGTRRMNEALVGAGGRNLAALEAAKRIQLGEIAFPSIGFEWFNPGEMAIRLGAVDESIAAPAPSRRSQDAVETDSGS